VVPGEANDVLRLLKDRLAAISDVRGIESLLLWDQQTYMPAGGVAGRAEQVATLRHLAHELLVSGEMGRLLGSVNQPEPESEDFSLLRLARREYGRATRLPARLVEELARATALAEPAWRRARAVSDWGTLAPHLEKILALQRETAESLGYEDHPYDALLDLYEPGARKVRLEETFGELKTALVPMVRKISAAQTRIARVRSTGGSRRPGKRSSGVRSSPLSATTEAGDARIGPSIRSAGP
jgi:carboxypeptidase Taq